MGSSQHASQDCVSSSSGDRPQTIQKTAQRERIFMNNGIKVRLLSAALAVFALPVVAQNTSARGGATASTPATQGSATAGANTQAPRRSIRPRQENQQGPNGNGGKSGKMTAGAEARVEKKQARNSHRNR